MLLLGRLHELGEAVPRSKDGKKIEMVTVGFGNKETLCSILPFNVLPPNLIILVINSDLES